MAGAPAGTPSFDLGAPRFSQLVHLATEGEGSTVLATEMVMSFFSDASADLFALPTEGKPGPPVECCKAFLKEYVQLETLTSESLAPLLALPAPVVAAVDEVMTACRATVAITHPQPGFLGSTFGDAEAIFGDCPKTVSEAQMTFRRAALKSSEWRRRVLTYWSEAAEDDSIAVDFGKQLQKWSKKGCEITADSVQNVTRQVQSWVKKVRPGGLDALLQAVAARVKEALQETSDTTVLAVDAPVRVLLDAVARYCKKDASLQTWQAQLQDKSVAEAQATALQNFHMLVGQWEKKDFETLDAIVAAHGLVDQSPKSPALCQEMFNFRGFLMGAVLEDFIGTDKPGLTAQQRWAPVQKLFTSFAKDPALSTTEWTSERPLAFWKGLTCAAILKDIIAEADLQEPAESADLRDTISIFFEARRKWEHEVEGLPAAVGDVGEKLAQHMSEWLPSRTEGFQEKSQAVLKAIAGDVSKCRDKLLRVAGGLDNRVSWKAGLPQDAALADPSMKKALKLLNAAHITAIDNRLPALQQVLLGTGPTGFVLQYCVDGQAHGCTEEPARLSGRAGMPG